MGGSGDLNDRDRLNRVLVRHGHLGARLFQGSKLLGPDTGVATLATRLVLIGPTINALSQLPVSLLARRLHGSAHFEERWPLLRPFRAIHGLLILV